MAKGLVIHGIRNAQFRDHYAAVTTLDECLWARHPSIFFDV